MGIGTKVRDLFDFDKPKTTPQWIIFLAATGITLSSPIGTKKFIQELHKHFDRRKSDVFLRPGQISRALYYLKRRRLINVQEQEDGSTIISLTEQGKQRKLH